MTPSASQPYEEQPDLPMQNATTSGAAGAEPDLAKQAFTPGTMLALGGLVLVALALRAFCAVYYIVTIDSEGTEYVTLAANLLAGKGYRAATAPGTLLIFPPLYPVLIAAVSFLVHDLVAAARVVSVVMGAALVVPVFLIARHLYGRNVAMVAAALIAVHPFLAVFSATAFSETTYVTLLSAGVYWVLRAMRSGLARDMLIAGAILGVAYLARLEAAACALVAFALAVACAGAMLRDGAKARRSAMASVLRASLLPAAFLMVAAPYIGFLYVQTGQVRIEAKSPLNYEVDRQVILADADVLDAAFRIDENLVERGVWNRTNLAVLQSVKIDPREAARILMFKVRRVLPRQAEILAAGPHLGSPVLFMLTIIGLFRKPWRGAQVVDQIFLLMVVSLSIVAMFGIYFVSARSFVVFVPFMTIWASKGAAELSQWMSETARSTQFPKLDRLATPMAGLACLALLMLSLADARNVHEIRMFDRDNLPVKEAAEWIRRQAPEQKVVADTSSIIPFHAAAASVPYPWAESSLALRYLRKKKVDFLVLKDKEAGQRPYLKDWWNKGVPDPAAELVYTTRTPVTGEIRIYRLKHGNGG